MRTGAAISTLLGHLHETTSLKHYVHTLGVGLYAYQLGLKDIPLQTAFANRIGSRANLYRRAKPKLGEKADSTRCVRNLRNYIEELAERRHKRREGAGSRKLLVSAIPKRVFKSSKESHFDEKELLRAQVLMTFFEAVHNYFEAGDADAPENVDLLRESLKAIAAVHSGKRGSGKLRHPMPVRGRDGTPLPAMVLPGVALHHAQALLIWLERLRTQWPDDYFWLINKWLYASEALEGSMRLDGAGEIERVQNINTSVGIKLEVREVAVAKNRNRLDRPPRSRFQIRFHPMSYGEAEVKPPYAKRGAGAVRWVMTWIAATDIATRMSS